MEKLTPIQSVTVELDGRTITLPRSELDQDPNIKKALAMFDAVRQDIADAEYERQKLTHAHVSMQAQINRLSLQYADDKYGDITGKKSDDKESSNDG